MFVERWDQELRGWMFLLRYYCYCWVIRNYEIFYFSWTPTSKSDAQNLFHFTVLFEFICSNAGILPEL